MKFFIITVLYLISISAKELQAVPSAQRQAAGNGRIIGGFETQIVQYPYLAAINVQTSDSKYFCGGTLWGNEWIITAAQCADGATLFTIQLGSSTLEGDDPNRVTVATSDYFLHPDYNPDTLQNDIALIKLRIPVTHTMYIKSIDFLGAADILVGISHYALGWGQTSDFDDTLANRLIYAYVSPITNQECKLYFGNQITDNMVCIDGNYNQGICHGDTGTPLILPSKAGTAIHIGTASFLSANGCESIDPSGYTKTYPYVEWINSIVNA